MEHNVPQDRSYTKTHEWCLSKDGKLIIGISDFAQTELGDIVLVDYKVSSGQKINAGDIIATIEAVKTVSDVYSPITGIVRELNPKVQDDPAVINQDVYGDGWLLSLDGLTNTKVENLIVAPEYEQFLNQSH